MSEYTVEHLLNKMLPKQFNDKIFWFANKAVQDFDCINLYVNNENLVAFDKIATELGITPISQLSNTLVSAPWNEGKKQVLVSSGTFLWINNEIIVTQRDINTKYDPLAWTTPAGRCDDTPFRTALKETVEEIKVVSLSSGECFIPSIASEFNHDDDDVIYYPVKTAFPEEINQPLYTVKMWFENELIEEEKLWLFYDEKVNTIEFRLPLLAIINSALSFSNPEFDTQAKSIECHKLKTHKLVPALRNLLI